MTLVKSFSVSVPEFPHLKIEISIELVYISHLLLQQCYIKNSSPQISVAYNNEFFFSLSGVCRSIVQLSSRLTVWFRSIPQVPGWKRSGSLKEMSGSQEDEPSHLTISVRPSAYIHSYFSCQTSHMAKFNPEGVGNYTFPMERNRQSE